MAETATGNVMSIDDVDVRGRRVLMRVDFNVPIDEDGRITDDRRVVLALPSIRSVLERGGRLLLMSHRGRPGGDGFDPLWSLAPVARRLGELLGREVRVPGRDAVDESSRAAAAALGDGELLLLENLRFNPGEKAGDESFAAQLAELGDVYCNNAFGTAHRNDASMVALPTLMSGKPRVAGRLLQKELRFLSAAIEQPRRPFAAVLGGAKGSDKLGALRRLAGRVDDVLIGGAMAYTFLAARGVAIGASRVEQDMIGDAGALLDAAAAAGTTVHLPDDHVCAPSIDSVAPTTACGPGIPDDLMGLDIGPRSASSYAAVLERAETIVWNGPMGVFETPPFDAGTRAVANTIAAATARGAITIVGGGDSAAAVSRFGLDDGFSHVSTGGGASLQMLEGARFDSVELLDPAPA